LKATLMVLLALAAAAPVMPQENSNGSDAQFNSEGQLVLRANYREWVFLSSGLGMTYDPTSSSNASPKFTNVYVTPAAYRSYLQNGTWPEKTLLVLEIRASASEGSINKGGHYQNELVAVEAEVKDSARFPGNGWAFFALGKASSGSMLPRTANCYSCHLANGAVDNTFVQFYPTLLEIAKKKGTLNPAYQAAKQGH
jgi:hypothetical protein